MKIPTAISMFSISGSSMDTKTT